MIDPTVPPRTSRVLREFAETIEGERVRLRDIDAAMQERAFGLLMLVLALPNVLPVTLPGVSTLLGVPLMLLAAQLIAGYRKPWLPNWIGGRSFSRRDFLRFLRHALPWLQRLEAMLRPRLAALTSRRAERFLVGGLALVLSCVMILPIPLGNMLPAVAMVMLALGLLEQDGLAVLAGVAVGVAGLGLAGGVVAGALAGAVAAVSALLG